MLVISYHISWMITPKQNNTPWNSSTPWVTIATDVFTLNNSHFLCIEYYHNTFPVVTWVVGLPAEDLIRCCKIIFAECGLPHKLILDTGTNLVRD